MVWKDNIMNQNKDIKVNCTWFKTTILIEKIIFPFLSSKPKVEGCQSKKGEDTQHDHPVHHFQLGIQNIFLASCSWNQLVGPSVHDKFYPELYQRHET